MNHVERFRAVMNFQPADRLPRWEWALWWDKTIERWHGEGLPADLNPGMVFEISRHLGLDPYKQFWFHTAQPADEAARSKVSGGVGSAADYLEVLPHLYPDHARTIEEMRPWAEKQEKGEAVVWATLDGYFWFPRALMGIERHLLGFYEQPELIKRINRDLAEFHVRLVRRMAAVCAPAFVTFAEDMSYNHGPMISKSMFDEFLAPCYSRVIPVLRESEIMPIVDSDGDVTEMIPWLEGVGVLGVLPLERNAGVDGSHLRERFPNLRMIGHYDKMVMTKGEAAMRAEFERLLPLMKTGGFIPSVDHQTPPGVSLDQYRIYLRLLEEYTAAAAG